MMERWAVQLPLTHGCSPRSTRWPALQQWYEAMEAMPAYSQTVKGDAYSWASLVGTFQRMFANANATANGTATAAELAAAAELVAAATPTGGGASLLLLLFSSFSSISSSQITLVTRTRPSIVT